MAKNEIKYLTAIKQEARPKKYCRFKKMGIHYIDYKDGEFLKKFIIEIEWPPDPLKGETEEIENIFFKPP